MLTALQESNVIYKEEKSCSKNECHADIFVSSMKAAQSLNQIIFFIGKITAIIVLIVFIHSLHNQI